MLPEEATAHDFLEAVILVVVGVEKLCKIMNSCFFYSALRFSFS